MRTCVLLTALLGVALGGCGKAAKPGAESGRKQVIAMDAAPPAVIKAAQDKQPDVTFDKVIKADGFYEVQGKNKAGKVVEVEVSETGQVLLVE